MIKDYAIMFINNETKRIGCDKFSAGSESEAKHDFFECYRNGDYTVLSVVEID